ncbi:glutamate-1-semialdehyde 2,1-aminomutase [Campylobacter hyointestinalis subsp. hyointestinalis]|uniref:glutamate-1-semialdehyde 2,1-aminomutase n=1 Tax=Campylobacter hyointestinalis TaxID=198 RepID=UPI000725A2AE|nr:glutamate-1-semialdehyde 2,1-aminomutase [Campylobacter hyointestinalis]PPB57998.1 glutamate-1-semialdehyde 2,1-aminomutase [Campylobacter hyointestinalis subsp. hyointestinalis]QCT99164.1 glutamate-1-semialdehyde 2,1-aminomutase [Campylobacter hyointestinalis subsp. hyointestinalis]CUU67850.1 Glutamate-1-semialdehyde aminotransferase [Campylobacter hyointestinalis subsp. hyointestinalis]
MTYQDRLLRAIPGGAHTYSRGFDQYPSNAPQILKRGDGAYVFDSDENKFLDYGMALRAVNIGYANEQIANAAIEQIKFGNNLTRPSMIELEAAEMLINLIDSVDMVKFTKNGSTATTAAVKLARAYTGKSMVARCAEHPFFSYDDWFIGSTELTLGILDETIKNTKTFHYNDLQSLQNLFDMYPNKFACVILEPATLEHPKDDFLRKVRDLCHKNGAVFILDEMITGFRWHLKGAQYYYNVKPDICTFGKAMANGFSVAAVAGKREIMELGSIEFQGRERLFLLSTTHGAEMSGLGAFVATMRFMQENDVVGHMWQYGKRLVLAMNALAKEYEVQNSFIAGGIECSPYFLTLDKDGKNSMQLRTLFLQEMIKNGVLMPCLAFSYSHTEQELELTKKALKNTFEIYKKALNEGYEKYLVGDVVKPVFRKYN